MEALVPAALAPAPAPEERAAARKRCKQSFILGSNWARSSLCADFPPLQIADLCCNLLSLADMLKLEGFHTVRVVVAHWLPALVSFQEDGD